MEKRPPIDVKSLAALFMEWLVVALVMMLALRAHTWWAYAIAVAVIATRQHGLLMLYHDAVHGLLARRLSVNDFLINLFVGVPHVLPVEFYRPLHLTHHRKLGSAEDPERMLLYADQPWQYRPLPGKTLFSQLMCDLFVVNGVRTMVAWRRAAGKIELPRATFIPIALWLTGVAVFVWKLPAAAFTVLLLWFVPLLTLTNLLQKLRSFAEHSGGPGVTPGWEDWTYSWRAGWLGRLTIWPYNINRHLEHHTQPSVPWHGLPQLVSVSAPALEGRKLWGLLYRK